MNFLEQFFSPTFSRLLDESFDPTPIQRLARFVRYSFFAIVRITGMNGNTKSLSPNSH